MVFGNEGEVHSKFKMEKIVLSKNGRSKYELIDRCHACRIIVIFSLKSNIQKPYFN